MTLQLALRRAGFPVAVDGVWGPQTEAALQRYRSARVTRAKVEQYDRSIPLPSIPAGGTYRTVRLANGAQVAFKRNGRVLEQAPGRTPYPVFAPF